MPMPCKQSKRQDRPVPCISKVVIEAVRTLSLHKIVDLSLKKAEGCNDSTKGPLSRPHAGNEHATLLTNTFLSDLPRRVQYDVVHQCKGSCCLISCP